MNVDNPDAEVNVSTGDHFESLLPGESLIFENMLKGPT